MIWPDNTQLGNLYFVFPIESEKYFDPVFTPSLLSYFSPFHPSIRPDLPGMTRCCWA